MQRKEGPDETNLRRLFKSGEYHLTMGLRKLDENWLTVDDNCHQLKAELLTGSKSKVLQCLPGSESACLEVLEAVLDFLIEKWPDVFERFGANSNFVRNNKTGEEFNLDEDLPLEVAARLVAEDLNVLEESGEDYILTASATCFPIGWSLEEKIGWPIDSLHKSVPGWKKEIGDSVKKYFKRMKPSNSMQRSIFFVQTSPTLFHPEPLPTSAATTLKVAGLIIRHEKQTFRRLPKSRAILFTVRTFMHSLVDLGAEDLENFAAAVRAWPDEMAFYKGRGFWGPVALGYCDETKESQKVNAGMSGGGAIGPSLVLEGPVRNFARSYKPAAEWRKGVHDVVEVTQVTSTSTFVPALTRSQHARAAEGSTPGVEIIVAPIRSQNARIAESSTPGSGIIVALIRSRNVRIAKGSIQGFEIIVALISRNVRIVEGSTPDFEIIVAQNHNWASKCPERFTHGLVTLENIDHQTKSLWGNRVPPLFPSALSHPDRTIWTAAFTSMVERPTYHVYQDGDALSLELSALPPVRGRAAARVKETMRQELLEKKKIEIAATAMFQITTTAVQSPICSILNIWLGPLSGISMEPLERIKSSHHICESRFETGINVTPGGCFVDLHHDLGRERLSQSFGLCKKVWLLFPPTEENLRLYISSAGFNNRLARIGSELRGGIIIETTSLHALDLPAGALHAVFTTVGGFLGGINYSTSESLTTMSRLLVAHLPIFRHVSNAVLEDLKIYTNALLLTLDMDSPELIPYALHSWVDLYSHLQGLLDSEHATTELIRHISETQQKLKRLARNMHYDLRCACGHYADGIGSIVAKPIDGYTAM
ncbi:MAG: hypothetical protein M1840_000625 [Geoglossum simile]|nr:MAG: hypothetical protein M1840_000625 [Geoglossum simile]